MEELWGADTDQLDALARDLRGTADRLEEITRTVGGRMASIAWGGRDAATFRSDWQSRHGAALRQASAALLTAGQVLAANAKDQRYASSAAGGGGHSRSLLGTVGHDLRATAGWVGDQAEDAQTAADAVAAGAGGAALLGIALPPGIDVVDIVGAGALAVSAAEFAEVAGVVSIVGHGIDDPSSPELAEQINVEISTAGLAGPEGMDAVNGAFEGTKGVLEDLLTSGDSESSD